MDSKEQIPSAYVAWRVHLSYRPARLHRVAESIPGLLKRLQMRGRERIVALFRWIMNHLQISNKKDFRQIYKFRNSKDAWTWTSYRRYCVKRVSKTRDSWHTKVNGSQISFVNLKSANQQTFHKCGNLRICGGRTQQIFMRCGFAYLISIC